MVEADEPQPTTAARSAVERSADVMGQPFIGVMGPLSSGVMAPFSTGVMTTVPPGVRTSVSVGVIVPTVGWPGRARLGKLEGRPEGYDRGPNR